MLIAILANQRKISLVIWHLLTAYRFSVLGCVRRGLGFTLLCMLSACFGGGELSTSLSWTPPVAALAQDLTRERPAGVGTTVLIRVAPGSPAGNVTVPFRFDAGQVLRQCIPVDEARVVAARLESALGIVAWQHQRGDPCPVPTEIPAGQYTLVLTHDAALDGFTIFVQQPASMDAVGVSAIPGAIPDTEPGEYLLLHRRDSWLFANTPASAAPDVRTVAAGDGAWTALSLWSLNTQTVGGRNHQRLFAKKGPQDTDPWVLCPRAGNASALVRAVQCDPASVDYPAADFWRSLGGNSARYCFGSGGLLKNTYCWTELFSYLSSSYQMVFGSVSSATLDDQAIILNPRYRTDASSYQPKEGEVMLITGQVDPTDGGNSALVFNADSPIRFANAFVLHFRTGPNTSFSVFPGQWLTGDQTVSFKSINGPPKGMHIASSLNALLQSNACRGCDLSGLDLSSITFSNVDLTNAKLMGVRAVGTSFVGAKLANTNFSNANLQGAVFVKTAAQDMQINGTNFDGADLSGVNFEGSALGCVSMRNAVLTGARFNAAKLQCVDFSGSAVNQVQFFGIALPGIGLPLIEVPALGQCSAQRFQNSPPAMADANSGLFTDVPCRGTLLTGSHIWIDAPPVAQWREMNLNGALVQGPTGQTLTDVHLPSTDFSGGHYRQLNFSGADLRGVNFNDADLIGAQLDSTQLGQYRDLSASFQRAKLRGANLSFANAKMADFTAATLSADASAAPGQPESRAAVAVRLFAPMANFTNADLTGVDFSGAQLYGPGAKFNNTVAVRTRFNGATLSFTDFSGAKLQGADLSRANLVNATTSLKTADCEGALAQDHW